MCNLAWNGPYIFGINYVNICRRLIKLKRKSLKAETPNLEFLKQNRDKTEVSSENAYKYNFRSVLKYKAVVDYFAICVAHFGNAALVFLRKKLQEKTCTFSSDGEV